MAQILQRRDKEILDMRRVCTALEKSCVERNERRVANRKKEVEHSWEMLERVQGEYLFSIDVTALDPEHIDDLKEVYELKEKVLMLAEDYLWTAEESKKELHDQDMSRIQAEKQVVVLMKLNEVLMQYVRELRATGEEIREQVGPESTVQVNIIKTLHERYSDEFKEVTRNFHAYVNELTDVNVIRKISDMYVDEKKMYTKNEIMLLTYIAEHDVTKSRPVMDTPANIKSERIHVKRLGAPVFNGSIKEYASFKRNYTTIMENSGYDKIHLAYQLKTESLPEGAKWLVKNLNDYDDIWNRLDEKYGDVGELISVVLKGITQIRIVDDDDDKGMINLADKIEEGYQDLRCIGKEGQLANLITIKTIESKLPRCVLREWLRVSEKFDTDDPTDSCIVKLRELITFISGERSRARKTLRIEADRKTVVKPKEGVFNVNSNPVYDPCWMNGCEKDHRTRICPKFKALSRDDKGAMVLAAGACVFCLGLHMVDQCPMKAYWNPCDRNGCGRYHSRLLHGCSTPGLNLHIRMDDGMSDKDELPGMMDSRGSVMLLIQDIKTSRGSNAKIFWDTGCTTVLIRQEFAKREKLEPIPVTYTLTTVDGEIKEYETSLYCIKLVDRHGDYHLVKGYGIDDISNDIKSIDIDGLNHMFPSLKEVDTKRKPGPVDILIGMEYANLQPWKIKVVNNLVLYQSHFGTGKIVGGWSQKSRINDGCKISVHAHMIAKCKIGNVKLRSPKGPYPDFFSSETFGVDVVSRCNSCKSCKECSFAANQITHMEHEELKVIKEKLKLDVENKRWVAEYPWKDNPDLLGNNYEQVLTMLSKTEKRLSRSKTNMELFKGQIEDFKERNVLRKLSVEEIQDWKGPIHYLSIHEVFKDDVNASTPVRLVVNSALQFRGRSLNSMLMKGPSSLNDLYSVLLRFRSYPVGLVGDVKKMYQSIDVGLVEQHTRRILWRDGEQERQPDIYVLTKVTYGDVCAGCISATALRSTAEMNRHINKDASEKLVFDTYVDDVTTGANSHEEVDHLKDDMIKIGLEGGFEFKEWIKSGDGNKTVDVLGTGQFNKVLGCYWSTADDTWRFKAKINFSGKYKGARVGPDLKKEEIESCVEKHLSKRIILRLVNSVYDPMGLIAPFTIKLKLLMRMLYLDGGQKLGWDDAIPVEMRISWIQLLKEMFEVEDIKFNRCIKPEDADPDELPNLITFSDGSTVAFCSCTYIQWKLLDDTYSARLVSAKARIGPINKISVPRMELQGAVMNCRLHCSAMDSLNLQFKKEFHLIDSGAVMDMISHESTTCKEFVGTRVGEIKSKSNTETWAWIQSADNPADLGTRGVNPLKLDVLTRWQNGPEWLKLKDEFWPIDYHYRETMPEDELINVHKVHAITDQCKKSNSDELIDIHRFNSFQKLINATARVLKIVRLKTFNITNITVEDTDIAEAYWEKKALKLTEEAFNKGHLRSLRAVKRADGAIVMSGRAGKHLTIGYDRESLIVLMPQHKFSRLYLKKIHNGEDDIEHNGVLTDLSKSRERYWIPHAKRTLEKIRADCFRCRLMNKRLERQIMAPLPATRLKPCPVWNTTSLDLFGPLQIVDAVKRRTTGKCWGLIASCTVTRCVHIDITEDYSTDSMLMALRRFVAERGCITEFQSDKGSQLIASAKEIQGEMDSWSWDKREFESWATSKGIKWTFAPVAAPHMNGCSEALIRVTKRMLNEVLKNEKFTYGEMTTVVKEIQQLMNSRPLGIRASDGDPTGNDLLTGNHLLMGRATAKIPQGPFCSNKRLSRRFQFVQTIVDDWWKRWITQVFPSLVPSYRWHKKYRNVAVGDTVLMKEESLIRGQYKLGRVCEVKEGDDKCVRRAVVEYKICDGSVNKFPTDFKRSERAVHNLCVIVPAGYKNEDVEDDIFCDYHWKME